MIVSKPVRLLVARTWHVVAAAVVIVALVVVAFLALVYGAGGLKTSGDSIDWEAVAALSALGAAVATVLAVGALGMAASELEQRAAESRRELEAARVNRLPYLRVDVALLKHIGQGLHPPETDYIFDASDFDTTNQLDVFDPIAPQAPPHDGTLGPLILWVTNLQTAALGIAYRIQVKLLIAWDEADPQQAAETTVAFTYVAPGQTTAFRITDVRNDLPWLFAKVTEVSYEDIFGSERLPEAHGSLTMLYDQRRGVRNDRSFQLSR